MLTLSYNVRAVRDSRLVDCTVIYAKRVGSSSEIMYAIMFKDKHMSLVFFLVSVIIYFLPCAIAAHRRHNNVASVTLCNIFLGWTFIGWVIALIWASSDNVAAPNTK